MAEYSLGVSRFADGRDGVKAKQKKNEASIQLS